MEAEIVFANEKLLSSFHRLEKKDKQLYEHIENALLKIKKHAFSGIQIRKRLIPKTYINVDNLWKYNLPNGWRLVYTIKKNEVLVMAIILEWMKHKEYDRRFGY